MSAILVFILATAILYYTVKRKKELSIPSLAMTAILSVITFAVFFVSYLLAQN